MAYFEPIPTPPDAESDDPTHQIGRAASPKKRLAGRLLWLRNGPDEDMELAEARLRPLRRVGVSPARLGRMLSPGSWTATDEKLHPRWPKGAPDGRGGEFMRPGQRFVLEGKEWEISNIVGGKIIAHESSGNYDKAETRVFDPAETAGPKTELTGAKPAPPRKIQGGKGSADGDTPSDVTVVSPYVEKETHKPELKLPENSKLTDEQWQEFGELEQLHYIDLMERYGAYKASKTRKLIQEAYKEFDESIQNFVSSSIDRQFGASTGYTLSLTGKLKGVKEGSKDLPKLVAEREKALELVNLIRDAVAWDLYNRTGGPDVVMAHKDSAYQKGTKWWKSKFIKGKELIFSGLSQSHHFRRSFFGQQTGILSAISIRHILVAEYVSGVKKGAAKSGYTSEREMAVPYQLKVDERSMTFHNNEMPQSALKWLEDVTVSPVGAAILEQFRDSIENGTPLPIPPPAPNITTEGQAWLPPPPEALEAMAEYADKLPEISGSVYKPEDLPKELPWEHIDENGLPESRVAVESGYKPGDFMLGLKGTLYWIGPDPDDSSGFGLRYHKILPDGEGGLAYAGESYNFEGGGKNEYFKLKGNVPPTKPPEFEEFDPNAWAFPETDPMPIALHKKGDKFKVNGVPYEIVDEPGPAFTKIRSLETDKLAQINSDYQTVVLVPVEGAAAIQKQLKPKKGLTLAYHGKRHIVTNVKKDGTVSIKPSGGKVEVLPPDHPALEGLFDPAAWERDEVPTPMGELAVDTLFHGGGLKSKKITPYKVTKIDKKGVHWLNLDTEQEGISKATKKVRRLNAIGAIEQEQQPQPQNTKIDTSLPLFDTEWANVKPGDVVTIGNSEIPKVVELIAPTNNDGYTLKVEGESGSLMVGSNVAVKSQTEPAPDAPKNPEETPAEEVFNELGDEGEFSELSTPAPVEMVADEEVLTVDDEDTIDNLAAGSIIKIPSGLGDGTEPWLVVIVKSQTDDDGIRANLINPNQSPLPSAPSAADNLKTDGWPTSVTTIENNGPSGTVVVLDPNTQFGEIVKSVKEAQATSSAAQGDVTLSSNKVNGLGKTDLENAEVGSKVFIKAVVPANNQPVGATLAIWTKKPDGKWRKNSTVTVEKTAAELAKSLAYSKDIGVAPELVRSKEEKEGLTLEEWQGLNIDIGTVVQVQTSDPLVEPVLYKKIVNDEWQATDGSQNLVTDEDFLEIFGEPGVKVTIDTLGQPSSGPGDPEQDQTIDELPDLTPDFKGYKSENKVGQGQYLYRQIQTLPPGTVIQDKAKNNYKVVDTGGIARVTDGSQEYQINGSLIARVVEGAKLEEVAPPAKVANITGEEPEQPSGKVHYLTAIEGEPALLPKVGDILMGDQTSDDLYRTYNYEVAAVTTNGVVLARLDAGMNKTGILKQIDILPNGTPNPNALAPPPDYKTNWWAQVWEYGEYGDGNDGPASDPLSLLEPGDEFENEGGHPFTLVAIEPKKAFVKDGVSGKMLQVNPLQSQQLVIPAKADIPIDPTEAEPIGLINGKQITQEQLDWVIAQPPSTMEGFKTAWSNSGTYKNEQLAELENGTVFRPKGTKTAYVLVQSIGGGWVLVYQPDTGELTRVAAETRVRPDAVATLFD